METVPGRPKEENLPNQSIVKKSSSYVVPPSRKTQKNQKTTLPTPRQKPTPNTLVLSLTFP